MCTSVSRYPGDAFVKLPIDVVIAPEKLTGYLLAFRPTDDKSRFLGRAGFWASRPHSLEAGLRRLAADHEAAQDGTNEYGTFWRIDGPLEGPEGTLAVTTIWLQRATDNTFHFVTLKPRNVKPIQEERQ